MASETNSSRSVLARLQNEARKTSEPYNTVLARYAGFRFLYRLAQSEHAACFVLKGATMFLFWFGSLHRPTRDIDLLSSNQEAEQILMIFREAASRPCDEDAVIFDLESLRSEPIREEQAYGGIRFTIYARIGRARVPLQLDIGFGDVVTPGPHEVQIPGLIRDVPGTKFKCYNVESAFAEKLEATVRFGLINSRMKDFFDMATMVRHQACDPATVAMAIKATFARRKTPLPTYVPTALTAAFWQDAGVKARWTAFVRKNSIGEPLDNLETVCQMISDLVGPLLGWDNANQTD